VDKLKIGIIFGGCSEEHPVSVKSAQEVAKHLDLDKYEPLWIGITTSGAWKLCDGPGANWESHGNRPVVLSPDRSVHGLLVLERERYDMVRLDVVLPVLHGKLGEDGAIQGLLELSGIPYVGCDIPSSALCMDKSLAYIVASNAGIATPKHWVLTGNEKIDPDSLIYPVFVKPARSGSSFGVSKVSGQEELPGAIEAAWQYDAKVLIEEAVVGSEVGCAILGERFGLVAGELDRVALSHGFFRIHQESDPESGIPGLRPASLGRLPPATRRGLLPALVTTAGERPHETTALPEHRQAGDVRAGVCGRQVGSQPGRHRRLDAV
jgi:D-alanine--(R)-lactate ligase